MITKEVQTADGVFIIGIDPDAVIIRIPPAASLLGPEEVTIIWDDLADMEKLADALADLRVRVFRPLVEQLGIVYANRELYKAIL